MGIDKFKFFSLETLESILLCKLLVRAGFDLSGIISLVLVITLLSLYVGIFQLKFLPTETLESILLRKTLFLICFNLSETFNDDLVGTFESRATTEANGTEGIAEGQFLYKS